LKTGLKGRPRMALLMLDETIVTETPPLYSAYGRKGSQIKVPITGERAKRVLHGALNLRTGGLVLGITDAWVQETHQAFLRMVRSYWRGWNVVLFQDRGSPHTAGASQVLAAELALQVRWLPRACPELNAMDHLWRHAKANALASRPTQSIDQSADAACAYLLGLGPRDRLRQAGTLSGNFWLADCI
jgi:transposase